MPSERHIRSSKICKCRVNMHFLFLISRTRYAQFLHWPRSKFCEPENKIKIYGKEKLKIILYEQYKFFLNNELTIRVNTGRTANLHESDSPIISKFANHLRITTICTLFVIRKFVVIRIGLPIIYSHH